MSEESIYASIVAGEPINKCDINPRRILHGIILFILRTKFGHNFMIYELAGDFIIKLVNYTISVNIDAFIDDISSFYIDIDTPQDPSNWDYQAITAFITKKIESLNVINVNDFGYYSALNDDTLYDSLKIIADVTNNPRVLTDQEKTVIETFVMNESIIKDPLFIREKIGNYRSSTFMLADNVTEVNSLADIHDVHIRAIHDTKIVANEIIAEQSCIIRKLMMRVVNDTQKIDMLQRRLLDNGNMYKK